VRDIRRTLSRRWPATQVYLLPVMVQGDTAAGPIAKAIALLDAQAKALHIDTLIVARGGGSLEDLWAFNEEPVARAISGATTPVISGVGHEVDVTIADLVADVRAATPTAAAELAVPDGHQLRREIDALAGRLVREVLDRVRTGRTSLQTVQRSSVFRDPAGPVRTYMRRIDELSSHLSAVQIARLSDARRTLDPITTALVAHDPARRIEQNRSQLTSLGAKLRWALGTQSKRAGDALAEITRRLGTVHPIHQLALARQRVEAVTRQLEAMSHRSVLKRGFTITRRPGGTVLRSADAATSGDLLETELHDGTVTSRVEPPGPTRKTKPRPTKRPTDDMPGLFDPQD